jgi:glycosyltransferase involved in cell wall biosynthesis
MTTGPTIWFISEVYYPDEQGTAFYTTGLAEGLAGKFNVGVLCSFPTVTARGKKVARKEVRNGVIVQRCMGTTLNKDIFILRLINIVTYSAALLLKALATVRKGDIVFAVTSPPSTPFIARLVCSLKKAGCVLRIEDVYPEILVATGMIGERSLLNYILRFVTRMLYRSANQIVVLGRDMKAMAEKKMGGQGKSIRIIRSWADTDLIIPIPKEDTALVRELGLQKKFVVSCVGNMGRAQAIEFLFETASMLKDDDRIHFLFIGGGARRKWMELEAVNRGLKNVTLLDQRPRDDQANFLNACDISLISLLPGVTGAGVPSRTYNIMAAGKPIIAVTGEDSEVAMLVREEAIGWVAPPYKPEHLVRTILEAMSDKQRLIKMGCNASAAARVKFPREKIVEEYRVLVKEIIYGYRSFNTATGETIRNRSQSIQ